MMTEEQVVIGNLYWFDRDKETERLLKAESYWPNHLDGIGAIFSKEQCAWFTLDRLTPYEY